MPPLVETEALSYRVDGTRILDGVDLAVDRGELHAVLGPSGAGKTTLLRLVVRLDEPTSGRVLVDGKDTRGIDPQALRRRVGWVPQQPAFTEPTLGENATIAPRLTGGTVDEARVRTLLARVGLGGRWGQPIEELSGGERQRLGLVRTLVGDPDVLLLDEPTANLDRALEADVEELLDTLVSQGTACLMVTHAPGQARRLADSVSRLVAGRVSASGSPREVLP